MITNIGLTYDDWLGSDEDGYEAQKECYECGRIHSKKGNYCSESCRQSSEL